MNEADKITLDDCTVVLPGENIFARLGVPNPEEENAKCELSMAIADAIKARGLTQSQAAKLVGDSQANISRIVGGRLEKFSSDRLFRYLMALGKSVRIIVEEAPRDQERGSLTVSVAS